MGEKSRRRQESSCQENINTGHIKPAVSETAPAASVACTSNVPTTNTRHGGNNDEGVPTAWSGGRAVEVDVNERSKVISCRRARIDFVIFRFRATILVNYYFIFKSVY